MDLALERCLENAVDGSVYNREVTTRPGLLYVVQVVLARVSTRLSSD
jgi:hypothetical protein